MENNQEPSLFEMEMDESSQQYMLMAAKWANFISVTSFIGSALFLLVALFFGTDILKEFSQSELTGTGGIVIFILLIVLGLFVLWMFFLYKAAVNLRKGVREKDTGRIADGFQALQSFFVFSFIASVLTILSTLSKLFN